MPKERRTRSISFEARSNASPFPCSGSSSHHRGSSSSARNPPASPGATAKEMKEWDEVRCSVCMEYPHNAVLLTCSSGDKGCQSFMCDTSYRHSNCLDQYKKAFSGSSSIEKNIDEQEQSKLSCPLCRGEVTGWSVVEAARKYMNSKARSCSKEACGFTGSYGELRKHARKEHPSVRPSVVDPERERDWRRMEQRRDLGDLFSTMRSGINGDDGGLGVFGEDDEDFGVSIRLAPMAVLLIIRVNSTSGVGRRWTSARSSRGVSSRASSRSQRARRGTLWGETSSEPQLDDMDISSGEDGDNDDNDEEDEDDEAIPGSNDGRSNIQMAPASRRFQRRRRRQLVMTDDDDDDEDGNDDGSNIL